MPSLSITKPFKRFSSNPFRRTRARTSSSPASSTWDAESDDYVNPFRRGIETLSPLEMPRASFLNIQVTRDSCFTELFPPRPSNIATGYTTSATPSLGEARLECGGRSNVDKVQQWLMEVRLATAGGHHNDGSILIDTYVEAIEYEQPINSRRRITTPMHIESPGAVGASLNVDGSLPMGSDIALPAMHPLNAPRGEIAWVGYLGMSPLSMPNTPPPCIIPCASTLPIFQM